MFFSQQALPTDKFEPRLSSIQLVHSSHSKEKVGGIEVVIPENVNYDNNLNWRVVGGSNAALGQFPYIVSLRRSGSHFCGGTIVSNVYIISAAHCTTGWVHFFINFEFNLTHADIHSHNYLNHRRTNIRILISLE